ncbi:MAG: anthranilate phosphoribosyltransferase, partial [Phycisphaerales bacterium]|nr:anthranilate phosphoribosyltransferase [Phycisphaerales bacterium]
MLATSFEPVPNTLCLDVLTNLLAWEPLSQAAAYAAASAILDGQWTDAQTAALLTGIQMRGPAIDELAGFVAAVRERSIKVNVNHPDVIDTCGTGGSGLNSINVSTATAIVAAAAGCCVAKHGNRSVSSRAGSTDVLLALGVPMDSEPQSAAERLDTTGIAFLHAPNFHPGLRRVADVRRSLGFRTIFNLVGPLANPAGVRRQLIGAYCGVMLCDIVETLRRLGSKHILAVHGQDGADEITLTAPTMVCELRNGVIHEYIIEPEQFDISRCKPSDIRGGDALANAEAIERALKNQASPVRDFILLNAGAAI